MLAIHARTLLTLFVATAAMAAPVSAAAATPLYDATRIETPDGQPIYALGLAAAMVGPLPGGLGATEASLTALLVAAGAAAPAAAAAVLAFRLFDFWLPTAIGLAVGARSSRARRDVVAAPVPVPAPAELAVAVCAGSR